jgi:hypothetical protein
MGFEPYFPGRPDISLKIRYNVLQRRINKKSRQASLDQRGEIATDGESMPSGKGQFSTGPADDFLNTGLVFEGEG